jgi:hypothetical protein
MDSVLQLDTDEIRVFFPLFQQGVEIEARIGTSLKDLLCRQYKIPPDYLEERVKTIFLNGKAVDDPEQALVSENCVIALSAAMPGLAGAVLRRGGALAGFRNSITYHADISHNPDSAKGWITLKLFNLLTAELGPAFLKKGIRISRQVLKELFQEKFSPDGVLQETEDEKIRVRVRIKKG